MDAAFAPALAESTAPPSAPSTAPTAKPRRKRRRRTDDGLLIKLRSVLAPYFEAADPADSQAFTNPADPALVRTLYHPLYQALCRVRNITPGATIDEPASSD